MRAIDIEKRRNLWGKKRENENHRVIFLKTPC